VDFLLVLIELFAVGVTVTLRANIGSKSATSIAPTRSLWPKISGRRSRPTIHSSFSEN